MMKNLYMHSTGYFLLDRAIEEKTNAVPDKNFNICSGMKLVN